LLNSLNTLNQVQIVSDTNRKQQRRASMQKKKYNNQHCEAASHSEVPSSTTRQAEIPVALP